VRLSVIVPVYNGEAVLARCLEALTGSVLASDEIIVVDDGSTDATPSIVANFGLKLLQTQGGPHGPARARNIGARVAAGDILVFIDADVVVHADTLTRMCDTFAAHPDVHALFGSYDDVPPAPGVASRFKNLLHHFVHQHGNPEASTFWAGCGAVRARAFATLGGFDEAYRTASIEDIELGLRLRKAGMRIRLCPDIQATHLKHWTVRHLWRTDIVCRAVPWTRIILREGRLPEDLNLSWRSRLSAVAAWMAALLLLVAGPGLFLTGETRLAGGAAFGGGLAVLVATTLNADLHVFFLRHGGLGFAVGAWLLHLTYLLYSSAVFGVLKARHVLHSKLSLRRGQANP
jgi:GT2 family glycosyltransferase